MNSKEKTVLLYHARCPDGFGAAWAFWNKYKDSIDYIPVSHGVEPPDISGCNVFIADFCYKRDILMDIKSKAKTLTVLDHHKSSFEDCGDLPFCTFDMTHSGAYMAWNYLFPEKDVPLLISYIEDRDLWKWDLKSTESILSAVDSYDRTFDNWDYLNNNLDHVGSETWNKIKAVGDGILQYKNSLIQSLIKDSYEVNILGKSIPVINTPFFQSEIAAELALSADYAAAYYFDGDGYKFSLRSKKNGEDVSVVASKFGGGGHKNASGFRIKCLSKLSSGG